MLFSLFLFFFFFNDTATTEIYTLSLHDALPISCSNSITDRTFPPQSPNLISSPSQRALCHCLKRTVSVAQQRSEEHTSELQSHLNLVCRLLLEKKKTNNNKRPLKTMPDTTV